MSIYVHVKHYLNDEGIKQFDEWFSRVTYFMSQKEGYISLAHTKYPKQGLVHIVVCFENIQKLEAWVEEKVHDDLVNELDQYRTKTYWEVVKTEVSSANWEMLKYDRIDAVTETPVSEKRADFV